MELTPELSTSSLLKLMSFLFWSAMYMGSTVQWPSHGPEWRSRLITLLHGSVATVVGLLQCGVMSLTPWRLSMKIGTRHYALMVWSWGYFAFDFLWCLVYWTDNILMLGHHVSALAAITIYMQKEYTGCTFACTLAMMEITNPLLQIRWFLRYDGYDKTKIFFLIEVTYLLLFLSVRGVLGSYIVYKIVQSEMFDTDEKVISVIFYVVSLAFIKEIMGYIAYKYKNRIVSRVQDAFSRKRYFAGRKTIKTH